ncbi:MAG TPA: pentapeptide repeat-containing protein, partial [Saprospiraceae bacterium]|nr:pentapeptide repeat-containing protein [Saprospiraceae bacterium]
FEGANMYRTYMIRANLIKCNLTEANMTLANLTEANLIGAEMTKANITEVVMAGAIVSEKNWLMLLNEWNVKGAKEIQNLYRLVDESSEDQSQFRLEKVVN